MAVDKLHDKVQLPNVSIEYSSALLHPNLSLLCILSIF
jgi:hypothetical protein